MHKINQTLLEEIQEVNKTSTIDKVTFDIPALIRLMEICREDLESDDQLHELASAIVKISKSTNGILNIESIKSVESVLNKDDENA